MALERESFTCNLWFGEVVEGLRHHRHRWHPRRLALSLADGISAYDVKDNDEHGNIIAGLQNTAPK